MYVRTTSLLQTKSDGTVLQHSFFSLFNIAEAALVHHADVIALQVNLRQKRGVFLQDPQHLLLSNKLFWLPVFVYCIQKNRCCKPVLSHQASKLGDPKKGLNHNCISGLCSDIHIELPTNSSSYFCCCCNCSVTFILCLPFFLTATISLSMSMTRQNRISKNVPNKLLVHLVFLTVNDIF